MKKRSTPLLAAGAALAVLVALALLKAGKAGPPAGKCREARRTAVLYPDYAGIVIPPNIAPLNFVVKEPGRRHFVRISAPRGRAIQVAGRDGMIAIPLGPWRALLAANRGGDLAIDVYAQDGRGEWTHFDTARDHVAVEKIDSHLVYRWFLPSYTSHTTLGIYQRDLEGYAQSSIVRNDEITGQCVNCHTFLNRRPDTFFFHMRGPENTSAMMLVRNGRAKALDTRTPQAKGPAAYSSWHPNGQIVAFTRNWIRQYFREAGDQSRDALDARASLWVYWPDSGKLLCPPELNPPGRMPTFPSWSPDGRWLYFCSARRFWPANDTMALKAQPRLRYDLMRASFDPATGAFGTPEAVLTGEETGKSLLEPRVSPDGRFLLFCECEFGSFPVFQKQTDLYLIDLQSKERRAVPLESEQGQGSMRDSWHSWSGNSRWIAFSRKRDNGLLARPYLRYIDSEGHAAKAFIVPQQDPNFYDRCLNTYNLPELVSGPVRIDKAQVLAEANNSLARNLKASGKEPAPAGSGAEPNP